MNRNSLNYVENKLVAIRIALRELGRFPRTESIYERELSIIENAARSARERLERDRIQGRLFEETIQTETAAN